MRSTSRQLCAPSQRFRAAAAAATWLLEHSSVHRVDRRRQEGQGRRRGERWLGMAASATRRRGGAWSSASASRPTSPGRQPRLQVLCPALFLLARIILWFFATSGLSESPMVSTIGVLCVGFSFGEGERWLYCRRCCSSKGKQWLQGEVTADESFPSPPCSAFRLLVSSSICA